MISYLRVRNAQTRGLLSVSSIGVDYLVGGLKFVPGAVIGTPRKLIPLTGTGESVLDALTGTGSSVLVALSGTGESVLTALTGGPKLLKNRNFEIQRGTDVKQPFTVTLDQGRTLDGNETWEWQCKKNKTDTSALITKTSGAGTITVDGSTFQPTAVFVPADTPRNNFPASEEPTQYWHGLEMIKDTKLEAQLEGKMGVNTDVAQPP